MVSAEEYQAQIMAAYAEDDKEQQKYALGFSVFLGVVAVILTLLH